MSKTIFFPYSNEKQFDFLYNRCNKNDIVIFNFPGSRPNWVNCLREKGVEVLAYISVYKILIISELDESNGFSYGSVSKEEVEMNPFWRSTAIDKTDRISELEKISISESGELIRPFRKADYKKGWYQTCLHSKKLEKQIINGIDNLFNAIKISGIFIDNVVSRLDSCIHCMGINDNLLVRQQSILTEIYNNLKRTKKNSLIYLNTGRRTLFEPIIPADMYVSENFCFGDSTSQNQSLTFAGKVYTSEMSFYLDVVTVRDELFRRGIMLLGYTKINGNISETLLKERLDLAHKLAVRLDIQWTFRITFISIDRKKEILNKLGGLKEYGM